MKKAIKRKADELLGYGFTHQQVLDQLMAEHPEVKPKKIAEHLRYRPSLQAREQYRGLHQVLLAIIVLSAALRVWHASIGRQFTLDQPTAFITLVPIATLLVGYTIYTWQGHVFQWVGWGNLLGITALIKAVRAMANGIPPDGEVLLSVLSVSIGAISLFLFTKAFPKYRKEKDPMSGQERYVFAADMGPRMR